MQAAITVLIAVIGLVVGSFLNVVILRLHAGKQFVKGRSACPKCHRELGPLELVPVLSWLLLGGRCRHCKQPISVQYPVVEALTAGLFVAAYLTHQPATPLDVVILLLWFVVIAGLVVLAVYDLRWYLLPDKVLLPLIAPAAVILVLQAGATHSLAPLYRPVLAAVLAGGAFYSLAAVSRGRWMGGGDIKLVFVMGLLLGLQKTAVALFLGFVSAAVIGVALIIAKRKTRRDAMPFGPFLIAGTVVAYLAGGAILTWYLGFSALGNY